MKMKKIFAAMAATAISAGSFAAMSLSTNAAGTELGQATLMGTFGTETSWDYSGSKSTIASIDGNAQYECVWKLAEATNTGNNWFLTVVISPSGGVDNFGTDTFPNLSATLDEVWVDGVKMTGYDTSTAVDTHYYEGGAGVTRVYVRGDWASNATKAIPDMDIQSEIKVRFTVSGLDEEGTSNVTPDTPTTTAAENNNNNTNTTAANGGGNTTAANNNSNGTTTTTAKKSNGGKNEGSTKTGDAGVGVAVAAIAVAGAAAFVVRKKD